MRLRVNHFKWSPGRDREIKEALALLDRGPHLLGGRHQAQHQDPRLAGKDPAGVRAEHRDRGGLQGQVRGQLAEEVGMDLPGAGKVGPEGAGAGGTRRDQLHPAVHLCRDPYSF